MSLARLAVRRVALGVVTLFIVSIIVYAATEVLPGSPARVILGHTATQSQVAALSRQLGLGKPVVGAYLTWLGHVLTGNLGVSLIQRESVAAVLRDPLRNSVFLVLIAALATIPVSIALGIWSAMRRDGWMDNLMTVGSLALAALPEFTVGTLLVIMFATAFLRWLPAVSLVTHPGSPWQSPASLWLPAATLFLLCAPYVMRIMRASMVETLESEYVQMARLKGLRERDVVLRYALPNAIAPAIQASALTLAYLAGGIVVVEYVFNYPGIGGQLVSAVAARDIPVVQAIVIGLAAVYVAVNIIADVLVILVSPRLRTRAA